MKVIRLMASIAVVGWLLVGCANKNRPTLEPTVDAQDNAPAGDSAPEPRARQLRAQLPEFQAAYAPLPAGSDDENREHIARALQAAGSVLSILEGPQPTGAFRQQLRMIDTTRQRLAGGSQALAIEPTVNAGLRAVYNALSGIRMDQFGDDADVAQRLDALRSRVGELDTVRGPLHRLVVAQVFRGAGDVVDAMTRSLETRAGNEQPPPAESEQPATAPASGG